MFDPQQLPARLVAFAGVSLLAALIVPTALAVEPMIEGGNEPGFNSAPELGAAGQPPLLVDASAGGLEWSAALALVLIGLVVLGSVLAVHGAAGRRTRLATR